MEEDKSILENSVGANAGHGINEYANECIKAVCLNGESLSKYQRMIEKQFGAEFYIKCDSFVKEVKRSVERKKFTNTSISNLELLAKEINIPVDTVNFICKYFSEQFAYYQINVVKVDPSGNPQKPSGNKGLIWGIVIAIAVIVFIIIVLNNNSSNYDPSPYPIVTPDDTVSPDDTGPIDEDDIIVDSVAATDGESDDNGEAESEDYIPYDSDDDESVAEDAVSENEDTEAAADADEEDSW